MAHGALDLCECRKAARGVEEFVLDHEPTDQQIAQNKEQRVANEACEGAVEGEVCFGVQLWFFRTFGAERWFGR